MHFYSQSCLICFPRLTRLDIPSPLNKWFFIACRIKSYGAVEDLSTPAAENPWTPAIIMTNIVLFLCYCCHRVDPEHTLCVMFVVVRSEILWDVIWLPGRWIKLKEADAYGSDVLFRESELSGGIWKHITQSVEWYAPWELESIILSVSLLFLIVYFSESAGFFLFGFSSLSFFCHCSSELLWFAYMWSVSGAAWLRLVWGPQ